MWTRLDLDASVLEELRRRQRREGKTPGQLTSELLARVLAEDAGTSSQPPLRWRTRPMCARVDLDDPEAAQRAFIDSR